MRIGRPSKIKTIHAEPLTKQFSPRGRIGRPGYVQLKCEEFEALRLADYKGLSQAEAAKAMGVSQQTFSRVLKSARKRVSEALINGLIIKITGGSFIVQKQ